MSPRKGKNERKREPTVAAPHPRPDLSPWVIRYAESVERADLGEVGHAAFDIAKRAIDKKLKVSPREYGTNLHNPLHGLFKLKASHVRIAYHVEDEQHEVWILMIGDRKRIWEKEQEEILARFEAGMGRHIISQRSKKK